MRNASIWGLPHITGMPLMVKRDISLDPGEVALFSSDRIVFQSKIIPKLFQ